MPGTDDIGDTGAVLREVMDRWKAGIDAQRPKEVAAVFTTDAVFQGLQPYGVGRTTVADYYLGQAPGMKVGYAMLQTRRPAADVALGYLRATFSWPDGHTVTAYIGVVVTRGTDGWSIAQYQASAIG